jgi:endoglucanase
MSGWLRGHLTTSMARIGLTDRRASPGGRKRDWRARYNSERHTTVALAVTWITVTVLVSMLLAQSLVASLRPWLMGPGLKTWKGPLYAQDGQIVDVLGREVHLAGVNWFGFETQSFAPHGLQVRSYQSMLDQIVGLGFNTIRLPYSNQLFDSASQPTDINYALNPDLKGLQGLALMDRIIAAAGQRGLHVILDRHRPDAYAQSDLWYTTKVSEAQWIRDWVMLAWHYRDNYTVIGADLHNEPHGPATWGDGNPRTDWCLAAERAGNAILAVNPRWLIIVQGIETYHGDYYWWGGNLEGAGSYPVRLSHPDKLVYSVHDYGPEIYMQAWFLAPHLSLSLHNTWEKHWAYLQHAGIAPVLLGEFGGRSMGRDVAGRWQRTLVDYVRRNDLNYTYWSWTPDSGDTGGILNDDWTTIDPSKLSILPASR